MTERLWDIPLTWEWTVIKELGDVVSGGTPSTKTPEYWDGDVIWFAPSDLTGYKHKYIERGAKTITAKGLAKSSAKIMPAGSIMFSSRAPVGYVAINSQPSATNQGFKSLTPCGDLFNEYLYYYLRAAKHVAEERATGTTFKELSGSAFGALPVPIAPRNEQVRIVSKLEELFSELDKGVESLKTARAQLRAYRQAVLKHAFEGKLTALWREEHKDELETAEQLLTRIKRKREALYEQRLKGWKSARRKWEDSGKSGRGPRKPKKLPKISDLSHDLASKLPSLPNGWVWEKLGWITCGMEYGTSAKSTPTGKVPVLRMGNIQDAKLDWSDLVYTSRDDEIAELQLRSGDVLFNRTNSPELVGKTAIYNGDRPAIFAGYLIRINHIRARTSGRYLNLFLNSHVARQHGNSVKTDGVNQSNINGTKLLNYPFPYCSIEEQREIASRIDEKLSILDKMEDDICRELRNADALRQSVLRKAFSGQLVEQDPQEEPASVLLDRISVERERLAKKATPRKTRVSA